MRLLIKDHNDSFLVNGRSDTGHSRGDRDYGRGDGDGRGGNNGDSGHYDCIHSFCGANYGFGYSNDYSMTYGRGCAQGEGEYDGSSGYEDD